MLRLRAVVKKLHHRLFISCSTFHPSCHVIVRILPAPTEIYHSNASILFFGVEKLFLGRNFPGWVFSHPETIARLLGLAPVPEPLDIGQRIEPSRRTVCLVSSGLLNFFIFWKCFAVNPTLPLEIKE